MEWAELTAMTQGRPLLIQKVRLPGTEVCIEGDFELPPLAHLTAEEQVFVAAFVRAHGSIKRMEEIFGVSYPTVKNRLNAIGAKLDFLDIGSAAEAEEGPEAQEALARLRAGEISVEEALEMLGR